eukprot:6198178-Pleurochrysis_carterae.AAC.3
MAMQVRETEAACVDRYVQGRNGKEEITARAESFSLDPMKGASGIRDSHATQTSERQRGNGFICPCNF